MKEPTYSKVTNREVLTYVRGRMLRQLYFTLLVQRSAEGLGKTVQTMAGV